MQTIPTLPLASTELPPKEAVADRKVGGGTTGPRGESHGVFFLEQIPAVPDGIPEVG